MVCVPCIVFICPCVIPPVQYQKGLGVINSDVVDDGHTCGCSLKFQRANLILEADGSSNARSIYRYDDFKLVALMIGGRFPSTSPLVAFTMFDKLRNKHTHLPAAPWPSKQSTTDDLEVREIHPALLLCPEPPVTSPTNPTC